MTQIAGGCLCGAVRYHADSAPLMSAVCHCKHCQRQSGTSFSALVAVPKGSLRFEGAEPAAYHDQGESGGKVVRRFCAKCGSPIFSEVEVTPTMDWVKVGTLDDASWFKPQAHLWCDSAQPWVAIGEGAARFPGNPPG